MTKTLDVRLACQLEECPEQERWLVEELWAERAVGIVGGEPKACKSFLALDIAVAVASGTPCLRRFHVPRPGPVLLFAAEDALHVVKRRLRGIAAAARLSLSALNVFVITNPVVRLDLPSHQELLTRTIEMLTPKLLVLDPFVRLHRVDENAAADVAPLLAFLRQLERQYKCAVLLVHHARKGASSVRQGQALRGSSELHAWGDSNLYLRRRDEALQLSIEHRAAASRDDLLLRLEERGDELALKIVDDVVEQSEPPTPSNDDRILAALAAASGPLTLRQLRDASRMRMATMCERLRVLRDAGHVRQIGQGGYLLPDHVSASTQTLRSPGNGNGKHTSTSGETDAGSAEAQPAEG